MVVVLLALVGASFLVYGSVTGSSTTQTVAKPNAASANTPRPKSSPAKHPSRAPSPRATPSPKPTHDPQTNGKVQKPPIVQKPIPFGPIRQKEMVSYAKRHYGLDTWHLEHPNVIVEHYTAGT